MPAISKIEQMKEQIEVAIIKHKIDLSSSVLIDDIGQLSRKDNGQIMTYADKYGYE